MKSVLVLSSERHFARLIQVNLERMGCEVVIAYDGKDVLQKAESDRPDLILLDVMMSSMNGFNVLQHLKKNKKTRAIRVCMMTTKATDADVFRSWNMGCFPHVPFLQWFLEDETDNEEEPDEEEPDEEETIQ